MKAKLNVNPFLENNNISLGISSSGNPYKVLVIDDSAFIRKQLCQVLASEQFEIIGEASNGIEGLDAYKVNYPNIDLVTIDITMPKMDGISCLEKIMEFDPKARAIMVTAIGSQDSVKKAIAVGAKNYIVKPLDRNKVLQRIRSAFS